MLVRTPPFNVFGRSGTRCLGEVGESVKPWHALASPVLLVRRQSRRIVEAADREVERVCTDLGSTGLYPYAVSDAGPRQYVARQFPRSSGYPEDPATGIAAAALLFGLLDDGLIDLSDDVVTIRQGRAMGRPSAMTLRLRMEDSTAVGCWLGGPVEIAVPEEHE